MGEEVRDLMAALEESLGKPSGISSDRWLREQFPEKDWHHHPRSDGRTDLCDGTPVDCQSKTRVGGEGGGADHG